MSHLIEKAGQVFNWVFGRRKPICVDCSEDRTPHSPMTDGQLARELSDLLKPPWLSQRKWDDGNVSAPIERISGRKEWREKDAHDVKMTIR